MTPSQKYDNGSVITGLAAGTLVTTPDGDKKIEEVKAGDLVLCGIGESYTSFFKVASAVEKPYVGPILHVTADLGKEDGFKIDVAPVKIKMTPNHLCFSYSNKDRIKKESVVLLAFDSCIKQGKTEHIIYVNDLEIAEYDIDSAEEIARCKSSSNGGKEIERLAGFGYDRWERYNGTYRFMNAGRLTIEMYLPCIDECRTVQPVQIISIAEEQYDGLIYDLDVPKVRNFAANGLLIHDSTSVQF